MPAKFSQILKATNGKNKYTMILYDVARKKISTTHFGAVGYEDFISSGGDIQRKMSYLARHKNNENWDNPATSGACARWILWNKTTLSASYKDYRSRFGLELY
jgi:hypothetical protein